VRGESVELDVVLSPVGSLREAKNAAGDGPSAVLPVLLLASRTYGAIMSGDPRESGVILLLSSGPPITVFRMSRWTAAETGEVTGSGAMGSEVPVNVGGGKYDCCSDGKYLAKWRT